MTKRIAFRNGATSSVRNTASSAACALIFRTAPSRPSPRAPRNACGMTSFASSSCASRTNISPASTAPTCATSCGPATHSSQTELLLRAMRSYGNENIIVYAPTIATVESTVDLLEENGIPAIGYHGQMNAADRRRNQERWMADEVRVMVGTIAFGLGINKAAVRAVIHLSLPKSIEQFYQEAGRARARRPPGGLRAALAEERCGFARVLYRPDQRSGGKGARLAALSRNSRISLSRTSAATSASADISARTRNGRLAGPAMSAAYEPAWLSAPVEEPPANESAPSRATTAPAPHLRARSSERPAPAPQAARTQDLSGVDPDLREFLREWRRETAKEQNVPAFVVMHDTTLDEICRVRPGSIAGLLQITGIGERKAELYGRQILDALKRFRGGARAAVPDKKITPKRRDDSVD